MLFSATTSKIAGKSAWTSEASVWMHRLPGFPSKYSLRLLPACLQHFWRSNTACDLNNKQTASQSKRKHFSFPVHSKLMTSFLTAKVCIQWPENSLFHLNLGGFQPLPQKSSQAQHTEELLEDGPNHTVQTLPQICFLKDWMFLS